MQFPILKNSFIYSFLVVITLAIIVSCSTESNTFVSRSYHTTTARYNGHFNATELIRIAMKTYTDGRKEDFYTVLPIYPMPSETEVKGMLPAIDTAISKCSKVILNHAMPTAENMSMKNVENNGWIDENFLTIGKALFYKREYEKALNNFNFVKRFFDKDPSRFEAELWIAKIQIENNKYADAKLKLDELNEISQMQKKKKFVDYIPFYKPKKDPKDDEPELPRMNQSLQFDIYRSYADLGMRRQDYAAAKEGLTLAIPKCKDKKERARLHYILGQLYQMDGNTDSATVHFTAANKPSAAFEVAFNARLNRAMVGSSASLAKDLKRMLRDAKNAPYKDQIYYALANFELNRLDKPKAKEYLSQSVYFSNGNKRQKVMSYEKLGDLSYNEKNYISAQKFYDSASRFVSDDYPNGEAIKTKAVKLADLVKAVETARFEDSVQRIAKLSPKEREEFVKDVIKDIRLQEQKRKEQEAAKLLALQNSQANTTAGNDNKFVFNNPKLREAGYKEFKKVWGSRENEDDWRRSDKIVAANSELDEKDTKGSDSLNASKKAEDTLTVDNLMKNVPLTPEALKASRERKMEALYTAGVLYKEILNESGLAEEQFLAVLDMKSEGLTDLSSAFQLYRLNEGSGKAERYKNHIIDKYPKSDAANYFKDPDFYIKQKQGLKSSEKEYVALVEQYTNQQYKKVLDATQKVLDGDKSNAYRAEYLLLNVLAAGQLTENKQELIPKLKQIIEEKPGTPQAIRAKEMLDIIKNGVSKNEAVSFEKKYAFNFDDKGTQYVIIVLDADDDGEDAKNIISDFSNKKFKAQKVKVNQRLTNAEKNFILVSEFTSIKGAKDYIDAYKAGFEILDDLQDNKIFIISTENLKKIIENSKFDEYKLFYDDFY